jgi:hypothetical protein
MVVEDELRRMGVQEENVFVVAKAIYDAAVIGTYPVDRVLSGLKILMDKPAPQSLELTEIECDA